MATFVQFSGWNPNFIVYGFPGNDSSLSILHQATASFPVTAHTPTDVGPLVSSGLNMYIRLEGTFDNGIPGDFTITLSATTTVGSTQVANIYSNSGTVKILEPTTASFWLPTKIFAKNTTDNSFLLYIGVQTPLLDGTTLSILSTEDLTINRYTLYSSTKLIGIFGIKPNSVPIPYIQQEHC